MLFKRHYDYPVTSVILFLVCKWLKICYLTKHCEYILPGAARNTPSLSALYRWTEAARGETSVGISRYPQCSCGRNKWRSPPGKAYGQTLSRMFVGSNIILIVSLLPAGHESPCYPLESLRSIPIVCCIGKQHPSTTPLQYIPRGQTSFT